MRKPDYEIRGWAAMTKDGLYLHSTYKLPLVAKTRKPITNRRGVYPEIVRAARVRIALTLEVPHARPR